MANPTDMVNNKPAVFETGTTQDSINVDDYRFYTIKHLGVDAAGSADTDTVFYSFQNPGESVPSMTADFSAKGNKGVIKSGEAVIVGETDALHFITATGAPVVCIIPMA